MYLAQAAVVSTYTFLDMYRIGRCTVHNKTYTESTAHKNVSAIKSFIRLHVLSYLILYNARLYYRSTGGGQIIFMIFIKWHIIFFFFICRRKTAFPKIFTKVTKLRVYYNLITNRYYSSSKMQLLKYE